uniref:Uncharacterized protein n=1 Tax=Anguilla anguilla TaxID=7936 RepID=A0A0E9RXR9_ANGAN
MCNFNSSMPPAMTLC